ncbi:MAG: DUF6371 domain-containing protein, partial [Candidatus Kapaibacteriota bacterium]
QKKPPLTLYEVPEETLFNSQFQVPQSPFCRTCERITGFKPQSHYYLGAFGNDVLFFYRDYEQKVRQKKTIRFERNGFNRRKDVPSNQIKGVFVPFFGEERLRAFADSSMTDIFFVESEKTTIYCQLVFQSLGLWLGCGGNTGCTQAKIQRVRHLLSGKRLFVLFDNDDAGRSGTETALANFRRNHLDASELAVSDLFPTAPEKFDMADCILAGSGVVL